MVFSNNVTNITAYYCIDEYGVNFAVYQLVVLFFAPGTVMVICYTYVIRELWKSTRNIDMLTNSIGIRNRRPRHRCVMQYLTRTTRRQASVPSQVQPDPHESNGHPIRELSSGFEIDPGESEASTAQHPAPVSAPKLLSRDRKRNRGDEARRARQQVIKMLILVILLFLGCWGPRIIMEMLIKLELIDSFTQPIYILRMTVNLLPYLHACVNPFVYSFMSKNFRRSLLRQLENVGCRSQSSASAMNSGSRGTILRSESRGRGSTNQHTSIRSVQYHQKPRQGVRVTGGSTSSSTNCNTELSKLYETDVVVRVETSQL